MKQVNESVSFQELKGVVEPRISFDEFEPKTGEKENIAVLGFYVTEQAAGDDLLKFLSRSKFDIRDVEVTPNPNPDNYYMVFVELDRKEGLLNTLREIVEDVNNVSGELGWRVKPLLSDDELDLDDPMLEGFIIEDPENYKTKEEYDEGKKSEYDESVKDFFKSSNALEVTINENTIDIKDYKYSTTLELVNFGEGKLPLEESGLSELAIDANFDRELMHRLNSVRGDLNVVPINKHIVFHNPNTDRVLITKTC